MVLAWNQDDEPTPNRQAVTVKAEATTNTDTTPPMFLAGFPHSRNVRDFSFQVELQLDEPGTVWYVVVTNTSALAAPVNTTHVLDGLDGSGGTPIAAGSVAAHTGASSVVVHVNESLRAWTGYEVHLVAKDVLGNRQGNTTTVRLETRPDETPPVWLSSSPSIPHVEDFAMNFTLVLDEAGVVDWLLAPNGTHAPTTAGLRAGTDGAGSTAVAFGQVTVVGGVGYPSNARISSGLTAVTPYTLWLLARDVFGNTQATMTSVAVTTLADTTPPVFVSPPTTPVVGDFHLTLRAALDEPGTLFYSVVLAGLLQPTAAQVRGGADSAVNSGSVAVPNASTPVSVVVRGGLTAETGYDVFVVIQDDEPTPNLQPQVHKLSIVTGAWCCVSLLLRTYADVALRTGDRRGAV